MGLFSGIYPYHNGKIGFIMDLSWKMDPPFWGETRNYSFITIKPRHSVVPGTFQALVRRGFRALHPGVDLLLKSEVKS